MNIGKVISVLFYLGLAFYFVYSFIYPVETNYWLANNGLLIMILEFLSIFVVLLIASILNKKTEGWTKTNGDPRIIAIIVIIIAFVFSYSLENTVLFGYFVVSSIVKILQFREQKDMVNEGKQVSISLIIMILTIFPAIIISNLIPFPEQISLYKEYFESLPGVGNGAFIDNAGGIALWGLFYFGLMGLNSITDSKLMKYGRLKNWKKKKK